MLEIKKITVGVDEKIILNKFSLKIKKGEVHAIMGPNGTGKSTLSKVIMGSNEYKLLDGDILWNGKSIKGLDVNERSNLGMFLSMQNPVSIDGITNSEFIKASINSKRDTPIGLYEFIKKVEDISNELSMDKDNIHRNVNVGASGGERKKNEIFQMLMLEPKLIILDELDSGLDIDSLKIVCSAINKYLSINKDASVLIITHYPRILEYIRPNYVHVLNEGKIVKTGDYSLALDIEKSGYSKINNISEVGIYE